MKKVSIKSGTWLLFCVSLVFTFLQMNMKGREVIRIVPNSNSNAHVNKNKTMVTTDNCRKRIETYTTANDFRLFCDPIIFNKSKLIALIPAKTGSTIFRHVILPKLKKSLRSHNENYDINTDKPASCSCAYQLEASPNNGTILKICRQHTIEHFCNSQYDKYMIIRDPLARLLSGYLDKCTLETHNEWDLWHEPCYEYLFSVGIDLHSERSRKHSNNSLNSFPTFLKWLSRSYDKGEWVDNHFKNLRHFADMVYFIENWKIFDIHDIDGWDFIVHKLLHGNESFYGKWEKIKKKLHMLSYEDENIKQKKHGVNYHKTDANKKALLYYNDSSVLKMAIDYLRKDYYMFHLKLPAWICYSKLDLLYIQSLERATFDILPNCIDIVNNTKNIF